MVLLVILQILIAVFIALGVIAILKKPSSIYKNQPDQRNPFEGKTVIFVEDESDPENADGVRGHLQAAGIHHQRKSGFYETFVKRLIDIVLSFWGMVVLSPLFLGLSIAIYIDDPGPVGFTQKRIGKNKQYFQLHKFRSMKMSAPHDVPTQMLTDPERYFTRVGKFMRAHSLDELPQLWDIFLGNMSVVGPRPALWNQDVLTAEREKYNANDVKAGLTGWAQINGRDRLGIPDKARFDGEYVKGLSFALDWKCFLGSVHVFKEDDTIIEGRKEVTAREKGNTAK